MRGVGTRLSAHITRPGSAPPTCHTWAVADGTEDASVWGYRAGATPDAPWEPVASGSPLQLQLMGQPVPNMPLEIPEKLSNIVSIHEKLPYPEYYQLLSNAVSLFPCCGSTEHAPGSAVTVHEHNTLAWSAGECVS